MKNKTILTLAAACLCVGAVAAPATDAQIEELLTLTRTESMLDSTYASAEQLMRQSMAEAVRAEKLTPAQQRALDAFPAKFASVMREELSWAVMKPQMMAIYRDVFTQEELQGQLAFYRSPAGQAVIEKMPQVMQRSMEMTQQQMRTLFPRMQAAMRAALAEAKAATPPVPAPAASAAP